jgi:hypothetical protein
VFAIILFAYAAPIFVQQNKVLREWPRAEAEVVSSRVVEHVTRDEPLYAGELLLVFPVDGRPVTAEYVFPHESTSRERKQKQVGRYPAGSRQTVSYNPADPTDIRLAPGYSVDFFVVPVFLAGTSVIFLLLAGLFWGAAAWRGRMAGRGTI